MTRMPRVVLHLGPHKTATTYLQQILQHNRARLAESGVKAVPLRELRESLTSLLTAPKRERPSDIRAPLAPWLDCRTLILFDENFIGGVSPPRNGRLYPQARARLGTLASMLRPFDVELHLTLRSMSDYLLSRYSEYLRHGRFLGFDGYYSGLVLYKASWQDLVADIHSVFKQPVHVALFEQVVKDPARYLRTLMAAHIDFDLSIPTDAADVRRSKISSEIHHVLSETARAFSDRATKQVLKVLERVQDAPRTPFTPLSQPVLDALALGYRQDVEALSGSDGVRLVAL